MILIPKKTRSKGIGKKWRIYIQEHGRDKAHVWINDYSGDQVTYHFYDLKESAKNKQGSALYNSLKSVKDIQKAIKQKRAIKMK